MKGITSIMEFSAHLWSGIINFLETISIKAVHVMHVHVLMYVGACMDNIIQCAKC